MQNEGNKGKKKLLLLFISNQFVNSCHSSLMLCLVFQNGVDPKPVLGFGSLEEMTAEIWKKTEHLYLSKEQNIISHRSSENLRKRGYKPSSYCYEKRFA